MGSSNSTQSQQYQFNPLDWTIDNEEISQEQPNYTTLRNVHTSQYIDKYQIDLPSENDYHYYVESLKWRRNQPFIVRVFHFETHQRRQFCSSTYAVTAYLYHVKGRLSQFKDIPYPDNLYCMMAMLQGYKKLYDKIGRFFVCEEQVCINEQGEIRVWLNSDLSKNFPQIEAYEQGNLMDEESEMVDEILQMVINNTDESEEPQTKFIDFYQREKYNKNNQIGFEEAKSIITDYAHYHNIQIPSVFQSVLEMYQMGSKQENKDFQYMNNQINTEQLPPINLAANLIPQQPKTITLNEPPKNFVQSIPPNSRTYQQPVNSQVINYPINSQVRPPPVPVINIVRNVPMPIRHQASNSHHNFQPQPQPYHHHQITPPPYQAQTPVYIQHDNKIQQRPIQNFNPHFVPQPQHQHQPQPQHQHQVVQKIQSSQAPTPQFFSPKQNQMNPFDYIKGQANRTGGNNIIINKPLQHSLKKNFQEDQPEKKLFYHNEAKYEEEQRESSENQDYIAEEEEPIIDRLPERRKVQRHNEEDYFDPITDQRKVTQSQGYRIQESQHSIGTSGHAKYSAPSSQIYQYQSRNKKQRSGQEKQKLQYYYTVEESQELDPQIAADLLLYT